MSNTAKEITFITDDRGTHISVRGYYHCTVQTAEERQMIVKQIKSGIRAAA